MKMIFTESILSVPMQTKQEDDGKSILLFSHVYLFVLAYVVCGSIRLDNNWGYGKNPPHTYYVL